MAAVGINEEQKWTIALIGDTEPVFLSDKMYVEIGVILPPSMPWLYKGTPHPEWVEFVKAIATKDNDKAIEMLDAENEAQISSTVFCINSSDYSFVVPSITSLISPFVSIICLICLSAMSTHSENVSKLIRAA